MDVRALLASAPATLRSSSAQPRAEYTLADDLMATHSAQRGGDETLLSHEGGSIAIGPAAAGAGAHDVRDASALGPVYRAAQGGGVVVPTGRALVRFGDDDEAECHRDELAAAGFDLEQPLSYAPQAAWVRASSGLITDTLCGLASLERLPGVQHVEPQLITEAARRPEVTT